MEQKNFEIIKASGEREPFSYEKYRRSLQKSGASEDTIEKIIEKMQPIFHSGISTKQVHQKTMSLLKQEDLVCASRYSLKEALRLLGPTGFPFERLVGELFKKHGYETKVDQIIPGKCVDHEIDVLGKKDGKHILIEVKFHKKSGTRSRVQTPLYVKARFDDIAARKDGHQVAHENIDACIIVTNTKFTSQAIAYGGCIGLKMIAWGYPRNNGLERQIEKESLYPITALTNLKSHERKNLLENNIVICKQIEENPEILTNIGLDQNRKKAIIDDCKRLCK